MKVTLAGLDSAEGKQEADEAAEAVAALTVKSEEPAVEEADKKEGESA